MGRKSTNGQVKNTTLPQSTKTEEPHIKTLSKYKEIYEIYIKTGEIVNLYPHVKSEIIDAYRVEHPHYHCNISCAACVAEMLVTIYNWYNSIIK